MAFLKEFKEFALKGNVMDMAVGVIIGGAFGKIVSSLVNDILMPPIGALIGNTDFSQLRLDISKVRDVTSNAMHSVGDMVTGGGDPAQAAAAACAVSVLLEPAAAGSGGDPAAHGRDAADLLRILHVSHTGCVSGARAVAKAAGSRLGNFMVEPVCPAEWRLEILQ